MDTKKKVNKYLTDLKELSTEVSESSVSAKQSFKPKVHEVELNPPLEETSKQKVVPPELPAKSRVSEPGPTPVPEEEDVDVIDKPYTVRDLILGVVNLLSIALLIFLLIKLPGKSEELKLVRVEKIKSLESDSIKNINIDDSRAKAEKLESLFLDDFGVVNFVSDIEKLKAGNPAIKKVTFTSQKPVTDRLKLEGIPAVVELQGDWVSIGSAIGAIESLPYLFRPISIKSESSKEDPNVIVLNYGGLLYVGDKFSKN